MAVLGTGTANGGCSLLHAAGLGYGASLALDLPVKVRLLDKPSKRELSDEDNLLLSVEKSWEKFGHALPTVEFYWSVNSKIPQRQGLKSSSAVAVAAILALICVIIVSIIVLIKVIQGDKCSGNLKQ